MKKGALRSGNARDLSAGYRLRSPAIYGNGVTGDEVVTPQLVVLNSEFLNVNLISNTLTPGVPTAVVVKLIASAGANFFVQCKYGAYRY
ncbi:MAG: hypothetical protein M3Y27_15405 [Acidobacteriota bacterium]|nr:hypothetical protein [Acidobacteriota bacterium]